MCAEHINASSRLVASPTSGHAHVRPHLETWVNIDDGAPSHIARKVTGYEVHGGGEVVPGLIVLICIVV